jgi:serine phosphatase RsbU (regulator of sigma subunit)
VLGRQPIAKIANVAFLVFFALFTAGSIIWLLSGLLPIVADRVPAVHQTLHRWGAGDRGYVVASQRGLEQKASVASRKVPARELTVRAGTQVRILFENDEQGVPHNLAVYQDNPPRVVFRGPTTIGRARSEVRFTAPLAGDYTLTDERYPSRRAKLLVVAADREIPSWVRWTPGLTTMAAGAALDSHLVKPAGQVVLQYLFSALNIGLGVLLLRVRPHDLAARLLALGMIGTAAVFNLQAHSGLEEMPGLALKLHDNYHVVAGLAYVYALLVFPDGRLAASWSRPRWFKWPLGVLYLLVISAAVAVFLNRVRLHADPPGFVLFFGVLIPIAGIISQVFRLRQASSATQREQSRVLVWALSLALGAALVLLGLKLAIGGAGLDTETRKELDGLAFLVFPVLFAVIPVTLTVVLVRYRLWDIDRVINQTLVYGTLTGVLGLAYVASVVVLQGLLQPFTPQSNFVVAAATTLAVAALFRPARDRIQAFIDRRFYRSKYDATKALEAFSARLRDEIDLSEVAGELLAVAEETMRPARMALWLRSQEGVADEDDDDLVLAAAARPLGPTEIPLNQARRAEIVRVEVDRGDPIVAHLEAASSPVDIDELELVSPAHGALRAAGMTLVVPLVSQTKLVGLLALGPRRSERDYSGDDRNLLEDLAERAAPALRVAELVRQLVRQQAAEMRARERIEQELQVAQLIQRQFLPRELPQLAGWHVAAYYQPAKEVGGDFYDFIELPDGQLGIVVGDVTDKGVPAALVMATTHSILRGDAPQLVSPGKVLERANRLLLNDIPPQMFVTCLYGILDPATGRLRYANAGHNPPYVHTSDGVVELRATGMPLGLMPGMSYEEKETTLGPGDTLLLHSDGLAEAHDPERKMFGFPRLAAVVGGCPGGQELIDRLLSELEGFTGAGWEQEDDITLVAVQRTAVTVLATPARSPTLVS